MFNTFFQFLAFSYIYELNLTHALQSTDTVFAVKLECVLQHAVVSITQSAMPTVMQCLLLSDISVSMHFNAFIAFPYPSNTIFELIPVKVLGTIA